MRTILYFSVLLPFTGAATASGQPKNEVEVRYSPEYLPCLAADGGYSMHLSRVR